MNGDDINNQLEFNGVETLDHFNGMISLISYMMASDCRLNTETHRSIFHMLCTMQGGNNQCGGRYWDKDQAALANRWIQEWRYAK